MSYGLGIIDEDSLNIFTDGSSFPNRQRASGVGVHLVWVDELGDEVIADYAPTGWQSATIDEMEIKACSVALDEASRIFQDFSGFNRILIFSDSRYVVDNFLKAMRIWPNRKWRGLNGMPVENIGLWKELRKAVRNCPIRVELEWVKAHKKNLHNNAADRLAKQSALIPLNKPFSIEATTSRWSPNKTCRGSVAMSGQLAKIRIVSREYVSRAKTNKYRYEVIDPGDIYFQYVDIAYCEANLSRHQCLEIRFNTDHAKPEIIEIVSELDCKDYKY